VTIRVAIADDQALVRSGFAVIVEAAEDLEVVAEAGDGAAAVEAVRSARPDVVLMDIRMPIMDGLAATELICADPATCATRVIILTTFDLDDYVYDALRAGASGFLLKDTLPNDLLAAIRVVGAGDALLAPRITRRLIEEFARRPAPGEAARKPIEPHRTRGGGARARRQGDVQRRDRRGLVHEPGDGQDARQPVADEVAVARSRPARGHRL
jgi:DNA-binding NarL/FixJ family response regulator